MAAAAAADTEDGSDALLADVGSHTLTERNPEYAAKHAAYQDRKTSRMIKKGSATIEPLNYLSKLNEVDDDVAYRFSFTVVGRVAQQVVDGVCNSEVAVELGGALSLLSNKFGHRCLCHVKHPNKLAAGATKLAKLALETRSFEGDVPSYETRQESLAAAIVYVLTIDTNRDNDSDFKEQLDSFQHALQKLRGSTRAKLRPVKVVLLCCANSEESRPRSTLEHWAVQLADFEQVNGDMWKFGPIGLCDSENLHATLAEITSARIVHMQSPNNDSVVTPGEDAIDPKELELSEGGWSPKAGRWRADMASTAMDADSSCSEQERPPHFEAEMSGSECSETAREFHARVFGVLEEDLPPASGELHLQPLPSLPKNGGEAATAASGEQRTFVRQLCGQLAAAALWVCSSRPCASCCSSRRRNLKSE